MNDSSSNIASYWTWYCPDLDSYSNVSKIETQTALYACFVSLHVRSVTFYTRFDTYQSLIFSIFGLIGSAFTLMTLMKSKSVYFKASTYGYFRILAIIQGLVMVSILHSAARRLIGNADQYWYVWYIVTAYLEPALGSVMSDWADLIIGYLSMERAIACLLPCKFQKLQSKSVFYAVLMGTFIISCTCGELYQVCIKKITFNPETSIYKSLNDDNNVIRFFGYLSLAFCAAKSLMLISATTAAIAGFVRFYKKKTTVHAGNGQVERKVTIHLCLLQISQSIPAIANNLALTIGAFTIFTSPALDLADLTSATNQQIWDYVNFIRTYWAVLGFFSCTRSVGHSSHSYLYLLCSRPFRKAAYSVLSEFIPFLSKKQSVGQTQNPQAASNIPMISVVPALNTRPREAWKM